MQLRDSKVLALVTFACLGAISAHCYLTELSLWGMSLLFVASGFFLCIGHYDDFPDDLSVKRALSFAASKFKLIYPLYVICIAAAIAPKAYFALRGYGGLGRDDVVGIILNVLLLQAWSPEYMFSGNGVGWFFSVCLPLFMLFPAILSLVRKIKTKGECFAAAVIITAAQLLISFLAHRFLPAVDSKWFNTCLPLCRIFDFTLGIIAGHIIKAFPHSETVPAKSALFELGAIMLSGLSIFIYYRTYLDNNLNWLGFALIFALPSFALVLCFARGEGIFSAVLGNRFFRNLGSTGAAVYLVHSVVIQAGSSLAVRLQIPENIQRVIVPIGIVVVCFLIGYICKLFYRKKVSASCSC